LSGKSVGALFLSPHFDDVALSCGGIVAHAAADGPTHVITVFAAQPAGDLNDFARFQHDRWGTREDTVDRRREEDSAAMRALGAIPVWLDFPDAIYRGDLYLSDDDLFGPVKPDDEAAGKAVQEAVARMVDALRPPVLYAPLGIGGHVDHRVTLAAALACHATGLDLLLYEDLPYAATEGAVDDWVSKLSFKVSPHVVDVTPTIGTRIHSIAEYRSQLPTIFRHHGVWESVVRDYASRISGQSGTYSERFWRVMK
jgi:LmbE family N-acetylglucosaminyl deacetylase